MLFFVVGCTLVSDADIAAVHLPGLDLVEVAEGGNPWPPPSGLRPPPPGKSRGEDGDRRSGFGLRASGPGVTQPSRRSKPPRDSRGLSPVSARARMLSGALLGRVTMRVEGAEWRCAASAASTRVGRTQHQSAFFGFGCPESWQCPPSIPTRRRRDLHGDLVAVRPAPQTTVGITKPAASQSAMKSSGGGATKRTRSPVPGWSKASSHACSIG